MDRKKLLFIAHRGASYLAPENTLASFQLARDLKAHGFECDIRRCQSGQLVLLHDSSVERTTNYLELKDKFKKEGIVTPLVNHFPLEALKQLDAGTWKNPKYRGEQIPTLTEFLKFAARNNTTSSEMFILEVKTKRYLSNGLEKNILNELENTPLSSPFMVASFNPLFLWRMKQKNKSINLGLISEASPPLMRKRRLWATILKPKYLLLEIQENISAEVKWAVSQGMKVFVWTLDTREEIESVVDLEIEGVISNRLELLDEFPETLRVRFKGS